MTIDGSNELIGKQVLKLYNTIYRRTNSLVVYSNSIKNDLSIGSSDEYDKSIR